MQIYCITERTPSALRKTVKQKRRQGWKTHGKPMDIGRDAVVQMMVKRQRIVWHKAMSYNNVIVGDK